jgi:hypothetical protein
MSTLAVSACSVKFAPGTITRTNRAHPFSRVEQASPALLTESLRSADLCVLKKGLSRPAERRSCWSLDGPGQ